LFTQGFRLAFSRRDAKAVNTRIDGIYFRGMYLGYLQYGAAAEIRANPTRSDFRILPPLRGRLEATVGAESVACAPGSAIVTSPWHGTLVRSKAGSAWINLFLRGPALTRQLAALLGDTPRWPLELAPLLDCTKGYGRSLTRCVGLAVADFEDAQTRWNPLAMTQFEQFVMTLFLLSHPHNYREALHRLERPAAPRAVRNAIDFIEANLQAPIELADLVGVSGIAGRTLCQQFHHFRGVSPMRYLLNARLDRARAMLLHPIREASVGDIAASLGFQHLSRFAAQYRMRFGELPSATMRRNS
jgi:AraC-like DNA-binding protein